MESRDKILGYLNELFNVADFKDHGPIGLQVEGKQQVDKIVTGVSASHELFEKAHAAGADMIIVHHGLLWDGDSRVVTGLLKKRLISLLSKDITLLAYHLPLDAHQGIGKDRYLPYAGRKRSARAGPEGCGRERRSRSEPETSGSQSYPARTPGRT